jgi:leucyl-tRNA synthetase
MRRLPGTAGWWPCGLARGRPGAAGRESVRSRCKSWASCAARSRPPGAAAAEVIAAAEAEPNVARLLDGKRIVKRIHVPDRIVNFVVAG